MNVKTRLFILGTFSLLLLGSCHKEDTSWGTNWVFPLINDTLLMNDYVNDSTLTIVPPGFYEMDLTRTIMDVGMEDLLDIPDTTIVQSYHISVGNLTISPGTSIVNQVQEHTFDLNDIQLKKIHVTAGKIHVKVINPLLTAAYFTVDLPGVTKNSIEFSEEYLTPAATLLSSGISEEDLDLAGYDIDLTGSDGTSYNVLQSLLKVKSDPLGQSVLLTAQDLFKVEATFSDLKFDYARGYFGNLELSDTSETIINGLSNITDGLIDLASANVSLVVESGLKAEAKAIITMVKNTNNQGNTVSLSGSDIGVPVYLDPASGSWSTLVNSVSTLSFTSANSNIESFLENLGSDVQIGYKIVLNPWGNTSGGWNEIFPESRLKVKLNASMPMTLTVDNLTLRDTFDFDLSQEKNKSKIKAGTIVLDALNAFPYAAGVKIYLLDENGGLLHTVLPNNLVSGNFVSDIVESSLTGYMDATDGLMKKQSLVEFQLPETVIQDLGVIKKIAVEAVLNSKDASNAVSQVSIPLGAFLKLKAKANFELKIKY